jgi:hypothetical protein
MKHFEIPQEEDAVKADNQARVVEPYDSSAERDESIKLEAGQCETVKQDGQRCRAHALGGKSACFFHDSGSAEERTAASSRGGSGKHSATLPAGTPDFPLRNSTDAAALLARTVNQLLRGEIDPKIAKWGRVPDWHPNEGAGRESFGRALERTGGGDWQTSG